MSEIVTIDQDLCTGYGVCTEMCLMQILRIDEDTDSCRVADDSLCKRLKGCERACPAGAIKVH